MVEVEWPPCGDRSRVAIEWRPSGDRVATDTDLRFGQRECNHMYIIQGPSPPLCLTQLHGLACMGWPAWARVRGFPPIPLEEGGGEGERAEDPGSYVSMVFAHTAAGSEYVQQCSYDSTSSEVECIVLGCSFMCCMCALVLNFFHYAISSSSPPTPSCTRCRRRMITLDDRHTKITDRLTIDGTLHTRSKHLFLPAALLDELLDVNA